MRSTLRLLADLLRGGAPTVDAIGRIIHWRTARNRKVLARFLADAYYSHEITPRDYNFLSDKAARTEWRRP